MSKVVVLQHVAFEGPGRILPVFRDFGIPVEVRHLYKGDEVPTSFDEIRLLVVMGGPMGVSDIGSEKYPFLAKEAELLKKAVAEDRAVLGICLGAQLIAHAGGARVYPNTKFVPPPKPGEPAPPPGDPLPEIGWGPVTFPFPGGTEPIVMGMHDGSMMFHWHFDTFDLPKLPPPPNAPPPPAPPAPTGNSLLSSSRNCRNQAFRFKNRLIGFQYHFEMTREGIDALLENDRASAEKVLGADGIAKMKEDTARHYDKFERQGNRLLTNIVQFMKAY